MQSIRKQVIFYLLALFFISLPILAKSFSLTTFASQARLTNSVVDIRGNIPSPDWWSDSTCDYTNYKNATGIASSLVTSYRGLQSCGPLPRLVKTGDNYVSYYPGAPKEQEWECTDLVKRWLYLAYGLPDEQANGNQILDAYAGNFLQKILNKSGSGVAPIIGDVLSYNSNDPNNTAGHTSLVTNSQVNGSGYGSITVIEQNGSTTGINTHQVTNWWVDGSNDNGTVIGWLTPIRQPGNWINIASQNILPDDNNLMAISAVSTSDVWAVGDHFHPQTPGNFTLIEHWDGNQWTVIPSPSPGPTENTLYGVKAISSSDVWAVGEYIPSGSKTERPLTLHWNGKVWSFVSSPTTGTGDNQLSGVTALASNDVWAVGSAYNNRLAKEFTYTMHWNGSKWSTVPIPPQRNYNASLSAITAISSKDVWAVGSSSSTTSGQYSTYVQHWDGKQWKSFPAPALGIYDNLNSVTAISSTNVWAVGTYNIDNHDYRAIIVHWNGTQWSKITIPDPGNNTSLAGAAALASNNIWAVGFSTVYDGSPSNTYVLHWNGTSWTVVSSTNEDTNGTNLNAIVALSSQDIWGVGAYGASNTLSGLGLTFVTHYS